MEFRGIMGGFYRISEWIMRLSVINVLWVICAFPFFLVGLLLLQAQSTDQVLQSFLLLAILAPFTLFPSTAAMFTVARKWLTGEEDAPLFKTFFRGYKENFVQSMVGGLIYALLGVILYTNFRFYGSQTGTFGILRFLVMSLTVLLMISMFHFFSIMSHLHMKLFQIVKNALLITIGNPIRSLSMIVLNGVVIYVSFTKFTFLIPFFMGSLIAVISFWHFNLIFGKLQEKQQELANKEAEALAEQEGSDESGDGDKAAVQALEEPEHDSREFGHTKKE
ncbi:YesL family protein [Paenibacillus cremeus]|uniref:DUF624 domain-containing protein n=1 Tax=Paenibacillus cremeus TaxID=2163881 RepID=A0A559K7Z5_9BACL|nr:DUF624 domain-containing protein [Paenibacillus cremeus]TVY08251.1 DUF624 domain-containing protein [Paenibacillus cremeus]